MTYEYLYANWESIAFVIVFGAMFIGATIFGIRDTRRERAKAREEAENKKREGEYRVIRTKDKMYWVQQFVFDYPDKQYYPPTILAAETPISSAGIGSSCPDIRIRFQPSNISSVQCRRMFPMPSVRRWKPRLSANAWRI